MSEPTRCAATTDSQSRLCGDAALAEQPRHHADKTRAERDDRVDGIAAEQAAEKICAYAGDAARKRTEQVAGKQERQVFKADAQKVVADRDLRQLQDGAECGEQGKPHEQKERNAMFSGV